MSSSIEEQRREVTWTLISSTIKAQKLMLAAVEGLPSYQRTGLQDLAVRLTGPLANLVSWINDPGYTYDDKTILEIAKEIREIQDALIYEQLAKTYIAKDEPSNTYTEMLTAHYYLQHALNTVSDYLPGTEEGE